MHLKKCIKNSIENIHTDIKGLRYQSLNLIVNFYEVKELCYHST